MRHYVPKPKQARREGAVHEAIRQLQIGEAIAKRLPAKMTRVECAKQLGISHTAVRKIECAALFKLQTRLAQLLREPA